MHDMDGIDALLRILTRMKRMGWQEMQKEDIWNHPTPKYMTPEALPSIRQALAESKLCMAALNEISLNVGTRIRNLQKGSAAAVLEEGIKLLPDEILGHIFAMAHLMSDHRGFAQRVSRVSRRFREVSLRAPILWTRLSAHFPDSQVQAFISRSGQLDLEVSTYVPGSGPAKVETFLQTLGKHTTRWARLFIHDAGAESIINELNFTDFPRLRFLYFSSSDVRKSEWATPVLSHIYALNWHATPKVPFYSQLTCVELSYEDMYDMPIAKITRALQCMTSLQDLSLTIEECSSFSDESDESDDSDDSDEPVVMPHRHSVRIEDLHVTIKDGTTHEVAEQVYDILSYLIPTTLHIDLANLNTADSSKFVVDSEGVMFPYASVINIRISQVISSGNFPLLSSLLSNCDIAHTVNIEAPTETFIDESYHGHHWSSFAQLRNLRFKYCDSLSEAEVTQLVKNLVPEGKASRSLEIISCRGISEEFMSDLQDKGDKLVWKL
ncbi:hypothetical protein BD410DRAFT_830665 [Rickenella mellea]|uniref:F-box domain-containing protein n=1 Tax=Rickenella mellea TaxID=50990 RepID=A0A4Y7PVK7_9AGAM|nr:hypothetical protein BD410DRAFT_830665 [Rickenella mellea]